jgi:uncharacterized SAM-binding protein YcdF (DUF218 family)
MFFLKKLITPFIIPPGFFVSVLLISGALLFFRRRRRGTGIFSLGIGLLLWIFCSAPFSNFLMGGLESDYHLPHNVQGDVIILLGGGIIDNVPDLSGIGVPTDRMLGRIVTAVRLQKKLNLPIIVSGGKVYQSKRSEAPIVRRFLIDLGVEKEQIIIEENSRDTYENAKYTKELCLQNNYKNPILITSAYHMKRSLLSFKKVGLNARPYPANFKSKRIGHLRWHHYLPQLGSLTTTADALHEYLGLIFYKLVY